jgi:hypothetical protein
MPDSSESGKGRLGTVIGLLLFAAVAYASYNVGTVHYANYNFADKMIEIARTPKYRATDERVMDLLMKEANELRLGSYLPRNQCTIDTQATFRKIRCSYQREVEILPGWKYVFKFDNEADQPLI